MNGEILATIATVVGGFGAAMLFFRIQRELTMHAAAERTWLPLADWLLVVATVLCFVLVFIPLILSPGLSLPAAAAGSAVILVVAYPFAILAHYRIFPPTRRKGPREQAEPAEKLISAIAIIAAAGFFLWRITSR